MISYKRLWEKLKQDGITTYHLRNKCGFDTINSSTIGRLKRDESVSTNTLDSLCRILNCKIEDIAEFIPDEVPKENGEQS